MPKKLREILESSDNPFNEFMKRRDAMTTEPTIQIPGLKHVNVKHLGGDEYIIDVNGELTPEHARRIHDHMSKIKAHSYEANGENKHLANLLSMPPVNYELDVANNSIFYTRKEDKK